MNAPFDSLTRGNRYTFVFGHGIHAINGVLHEILPDGLLLIAGSSAGSFTTEAKQYRINPAHVIYAREETS